MARKIQKPKVLRCLFDHFHCKSSDYGIKSRSTASARLSAITPRFRDTDKYLRLVMVIFASNLTVIIHLCCTRQSRAPSIDRCAQTFGRLTLTLDLRPWPTIPAYPRLRSTPIQKIEVKGQTVQPRARWQANRHTNGRTLPSALPDCFVVDNHVGLIEAEIWTFEVARQGYLPYEVGRPVLKTGSLGRPGDRNFQHW